MKAEILTEEEAKGVKMIQHLQSLVGIDESDADALTVWLAMSESEQETTVRYYKATDGKPL